MNKLYRSILVCIQHCSYLLAVILSNYLNTSVLAKFCFLYINFFMHETEIIVTISKGHNEVNVWGNICKTVDPVFLSTE